jgi:NodT family efflux transporter outer membrane factor (OMF) lipoprotein
VTDRWWLTFRDPELESLVSRAEDGNRDLGMALSRVRQARIERAIAAAQIGPNVDLDGGYNRGRGSRNVVLPFGGASSSSSPAGETRSVRGESAGEPGGAPAPTPGPSEANAPAGPVSPLGEGGLPGVTTNLYQLGFDASWEIDLFGARRRAVEAADAAVASTEAARQGVVVSLLGEVAQTYLQLRSAQSRRDLSRRNIEIATDTLNIIAAKARHGFATDLEVERQQAELSALEAGAPPLDAEVMIAIHGLGTLLGRPVNELAPELEKSAPLPALPSVVPVGLPSELLQRRPDIRQAERELALASAETGVAMADQFPHFNLAAAFGLDSSRPGDLGSWSSHYYSVTPGFRWSILDWGEARQNVRLAAERQQEARIRYDDSVARALADVENALVRLRSEDRAHRARIDAVEAGRRAFTIARQQYEHGLVDSLAVLEAQRSMVGLEDSLAQSDAALRLDLVALYKALGGGWQG